MAKIKEYIRPPSAVTEVVMILSAAEVKYLHGLLRLPRETRAKAYDWDEIVDSHIWGPFHEAYKEIVKSELKYNC